MTPDMVADWGAIANGAAPRSLIPDFVTVPGDVLVSLLTTVAAFPGGSGIVGRALGQIIDSAIGAGVRAREQRRADREEGARRFMRILQRSLDHGDLEERALVTLSSASLGRMVDTMARGGGFD